MFTNLLNYLHENTKIFISPEQNIIFSSNKIHYLHIKGYFTAENSFVAEVTFKYNFDPSIVIFWRNRNHED